MQNAPLAADTKPWRTLDAAPFIRLSGVSKSFGGVQAVRDVSLDVWKGELFCLLGGSGCGKTTLLRMLAGFETPTEGAILIDGQDVAGVPPNERPTNMMFQSYALFPHMSVAANVGYGLRRDGLPQTEIGERVEAILELVQLSGMHRRKPHQLSGGQRQRVALARALVKRPKLLLLDEPLGALDKKLREETQFELVKIQESLGVTFIVVTHDQEEAMTLATRIGVMDAGRIVQIGEPHDVYETPRNRFVADFVGSVNLIEGIVVETAAGRTVIRTDDAGIVQSEMSGAAADGQRVWYAVRPEKLMLSRTQPDHTWNAVEGIVDDVA
ncbi:MAG: ABC transporter ATP-binding protein, partial [Pseudomonadota bacterium]